MDASHYREILEGCFPQLQISCIKFIGGGTFRVFEVKDSRLSEGGLVFRFPHGGASGNLLRRERLVCELLLPALPTPIPRYEWYAEGCGSFAGSVAGYRKLPGIPLQDCSFDPATTREVARQLGEFLSALHDAAPETIQPVGLPRLDAARVRDRQLALYTKIQDRAFPVMTAQERVWSETLFEPFLTNHEQWCFEPVPIHGDFDSSNILCDPEAGTVVGVIDFEEACLGDPAWDFCALSAEFGPVFLNMLLDAYRLPLDVGLRARTAFHARRILFHELLYGLEVGDRRFVDHGLVRLRRVMVGREPIGGWLAESTAETRSPEGFPP